MENLLRCFAIVASLVCTVAVSVSLLGPLIVLVSKETIHAVGVQLSEGFKAGRQESRRHLTAKLKSMKPKIRQQANAYQSCMTRREW
jgi:hypothetical protein